MKYDLELHSLAQATHSVSSWFLVLMMTVCGDGQPLVEPWVDSIKTALVPSMDSACFYSNTLRIIMHVSIVEYLIVFGRGQTLCP